MDTLTIAVFFNTVGTALGLPAIQPDSGNTCIQELSPLPGSLTGMMGMA